MTSRVIRLSGACALALAFSVIPLVTASAQEPQASQAELLPMTGTWKLDEAASENPSGAERPSDCARAGRGGGGGGRAGGGGGGGGGGIGGGSDSSGGVVMFGGGGGNATLGAEETIRFCGTLTHFYDAPPMMGLRVTQEQFLQLLDPATRLGYQHQIDDENREGMTPGGPVEFKVKWDDGKVVREINTPDSLRIVEEYELSEDGQTLTVTVEASSRMVRVPEPEIKRVYVRNQ